MIEPIQDTLSPAFVYRYEMDALVVKMDTLETTNSILEWAIVIIILVAGSTCFYILRSAKMRVKNEQLANKLLSKQAATMPNFIDRVNAISNKSIKLSESIYDEFQDAIDQVKREHKNGIVEIMNDEEFYNTYPYLKHLTILSVQEKFVLLLTENGYSNAQIALLLGANANTVRTVRNRVRSKIKQSEMRDIYMKRLRIFKTAQ